MTTVTVVFTVLGLLRLTVYVAVLALPSAAVSLSDAVPVMLTTGVSSLSMIVPVPVLGVSCVGVVAVKVRVSLGSSILSSVVGTRTMMPLVLLAGTVTLKLPLAAKIAGVKVLPPSVLTSTGVPVSTPRSAVTPTKVKLTRVSVVAGLLSATLKSIKLPSATAAGLVTVATGVSSPRSGLVGSTGFVGSPSVVPSS